MQSNSSAPHGRGGIYTLVQNGTVIHEKPATILRGQGSEISSDKVLKGRGKRKLISQKMSLSLADIAREKENDDWMKSFYNTYHCQNRIYSFEGRLYGNYCKNRHCTLCSSIRKAEIINRYYPVLSEWKEPYFVTLTIKACNSKKLKDVMRSVLLGFQRIVSKYRKRNQRDKGSLRLVGIKSLECNFNPQRKTYNPHLHLIVQNKEVAEVLVAEWLSTSNKGHTSPKAQNIRKVDDLEHDLIETIKYGSKIFTEPDVEKKAKIKNSGEIYARALYNIFNAMKGLRIFDRFGFDLPKTKHKMRFPKVVVDYAEWVFDPTYQDWLNTENELNLTAFHADPALLYLLENKVDKHLE